MRTFFLWGVYVSKTWHIYVLKTCHTDTRIGPSFLPNRNRDKVGLRQLNYYGGSKYYVTLWRRVEHGNKGSLWLVNTRIVSILARHILPYRLDISHFTENHTFLHPILANLRCAHITRGFKGEAPPPRTKTNGSRGERGEWKRGEGSKKRQ